MMKFTTWLSSKPGYPHSMDGAVEIEANSTQDAARQRMSRVVSVGPSEVCFVAVAWPNEPRDAVSGLPIAFDVFRLEST
jgi:hypothetical protein